MIVYIEDCLIENFLVTFLLFICLEKIFNKRVGRIKKVILSIISGAVAVLYPLIKIGAAEILFKFCFALVLIYFFDGKEKLFAKYIMFMLLTCLYAGANIMLYYAVYGTLEIMDNFPTYVLIGILYTLYYLVNSCFKLIKKNCVVSNFVYQIKITDQNNCICDMGFLDSGNTLVNNFGEPIFIINLKLFKKIYPQISIENILLKDFKALKNPEYIKSGFASGGAKILGFCVEKLEIIEKNMNFLINDAKIGLVFSKFDKNFNCNMLLNINAFAR